MKKIKISDQYRELGIRSGDIDIDNRTVDITFSSETDDVERYYGIEVLDHDPKSVDLSRLKNGASVLENHQGNQIGVVESAEIRDKKGYARIKFSKNGRGKEVFEDIQDNIVRNISFGYAVKGLSRDGEKDGTPVFRSNNWMPFEISVVSIPADASIGIGRSKEEVTEIDVDDSFRDLKVKELPIKKEVKEEEKKVVVKSLRELSLLLNKNNY